LEYPRESEKQKRFLEREKKTTTARSLFSLEEHKPATRGTAHLLLFYAQTLSLSLSLQRRRLLRDDPHKKKQADQEVIMTQKRKGQNAKRELLFF